MYDGHSKEHGVAGQGISVVLDPGPVCYRRSRWLCQFVVIVIYI